MSAPFAEEKKYFEEHRQELLEVAFGKFALIKGSVCHGTFDSAENAYDEGARLFPGEAFMIQEILPDDPIADLPAYFAGLIYAAR